MMRGNRVVYGLLLLTTVLVSGCVKKRDLVGRWDMGRSNFYFRKDGILFYRTALGTRFQGRYSYDRTKDPGLVRAELQAINSDQEPISLELQVTFLGPDRVRFDSLRGRRNRPLMGARVVEDSPNTEQTAAAPADS